jgi:1-deoxy-D-xylulose-5-phosphate reductoisomerase
MKNISLLGSTGSIGQNTLQVVNHLKNKFKIKALAVKSNIDLLEKQVREFQPEIVAIFDSARAMEFKKRLPNSKVVAGMEGLCEAAAYPGVDFTMLAMSGNQGLEPALAAISAGKQIGLANKEILVCAGELIMKKARENHVQIVPVDSEHSAIFECLHGNRLEIKRLILTATSGPFRKFSFQRMASITVAEALAHPTYHMGAKISVDCSTLMNKGFEIIEARWLFDIQTIDVIVHPQSIVHSLVEYCEGSMLAQLAQPDMTRPIQYALTYPKRLPALSLPLDLAGKVLAFEDPNRKKFPCLRLAEDALKMGKSFPCTLNEGNDVFVDRFLHGHLSWLEISSKLEKLMSSHQAVDVVDLASILAADREAREQAQTL